MKTLIAASIASLIAVQPVYAQLPVRPPKRVHLSSQGPDGPSGDVADCRKRAGGCEQNFNPKLWRQQHPAPVVSPPVGTPSPLGAIVKSYTSSGLRFIPGVQIPVP